MVRIVYFILPVFLIVIFNIALAKPVTVKVASATKQGIEAYRLQEYSKALPLLLKGTEKGKSDALYYTARIYEQGLTAKPQIEKAIKLYQRAAAQDHVLSQAKLGIFYIYGLSVLQDFDTGLQYIQKAADADNKDAQFLMGNLYSQGLAVEKDQEKAFEWYFKAAHHQHLIAQLYIARYYAQGIAVEKDQEKAFEWYFKAAAYGNINAINEVAIRYMQGIGVTKDLSKAHIYYNLSASRGSQQAQKQLMQLTSTLSLKQLRDAQQQAKKWQAVPLPSSE